MKKYSQYDEQEHILRAFGSPDVRSGRFLDIGAYNPFELSNTRALFESGWCGVMIEPSPGPMCSLIAEYGNEPRITLVQAVVACGPGLHELFVTDNCVSTTVDEQYMKWRDTAKFNGSVVVPAIPLDRMRSKCGDFDFVNFDTEGTSADLFHHALDSGWRPHCVCVEYDDFLPQVIGWGHEAGYERVYSNETNVVLVRRK